MTMAGCASIDGVSFAIGRGEVFGLVGEIPAAASPPSPITCWLPKADQPASKTVRCCSAGTDVLSLGRPALDRLRGDRISLVPQNPTTALTPGMRVGEQVAEVLTQHRAGRAPPTLPRAHTSCSKLVGLSDVTRIGRRFPHQLSGGQQQRIIIAMALACEPDLVVLDEPTTGLDVTTQEQIIALLKDLRARLGMSMLYVTHDLGVLAEIADRVGVMYAGPDGRDCTDCDALPATPPSLYARSHRFDPADRGRRPAAGTAPARPAAPRRTAGRLPLPAALRVRGAVPARQTPASGRGRDRSPRGLPALANHRRASHPSRRKPRRRRPHKRPHLCWRSKGVTLGYGASSWLGLQRSTTPIVVQELSFSIQRGEVFALVGESGSGKFHRGARDQWPAGAGRRPPPVRRHAAARRREGALRDLRRRVQ